MTLERKFTEDELEELINEEGELKDPENGEVIFELESEEIESVDREKNLANMAYVIKDCKTGKFYKAILGKSDWYLQDEYNTKEPWREVTRREIITYTYDWV